MTERRGEPVFFVLVQEEGAAKAERVNLTEQVMSFEYTEDEKKADSCKLTVRNWNLENFDDPVWKQGNRLIVSWGYPGNMAQPRTVTIQKVTGFQDLSIEAQGEEAQMNKQTKCRVFRSMTRAEVVKQIAIEHGFDIPEINKPRGSGGGSAAYRACLSDLAAANRCLQELLAVVGPPTVQQELQITAQRDLVARTQRRCNGLRPVETGGTIEDTEVREETITQARQTDAQFLRRLAEIEGFEFFADVDGLHFHQRRLGQAPKMAFTWFPEEGRGDIIKINISNDIFAKPEKKAGKVTVMARDPKTKEDVTETGSDATTERDKTAPVLFVVDPRTTELVEQPATASEDMRPTTQSNKKAAKREADGAYRKGQNQSVEMDIDLVGNPRVVAKGIYEIRNISKRLSGLYYFKSVSHKISSGYTTSCKASSDGTQGFEGKKNAGGPVSPELAACLSDLAAAKRELVELQNFVGPLSPIQEEIRKAQQALITRTQKRCGALRANRGKSKTNEGKAKSGSTSDNELEQRVGFDKRTGAQETSYVDSGKANTDTKASK